MNGRGTRPAMIAASPPAVCGMLPVIFMAEDEFLTVRS
jgi:hypothetical protein